ncbi:hypothetical protein [Vibrio phage vB_VpaP_SJSY21]|nr:hypothetical protein [Vibrio phage vB_VpaP_SJSY21]
MSYKYLKLGKHGEWSVVCIVQEGEQSTLIKWTNGYSKWIPKDLLNFRECPGAMDEYMRLTYGH